MALRKAYIKSQFDHVNLTGEHSDVTYCNELDNETCMHCLVISVLYYFDLLHLYIVSHLIFVSLALIRYWP